MVERDRERNQIKSLKLKLTLSSSYFFLLFSSLNCDDFKVHFILLWWIIQSRWFLWLQRTHLLLFVWFICTCFYGSWLWFWWWWQKKESRWSESSQEMTRFVIGEVAVILRFRAWLWGLNKIEPFFCHHQITLLQSDAVDASH